MRRLFSALILSSAALAPLPIAGCGRDPGERMGAKYTELVELVRKHRASPDRALSEASAWHKKNEKDLAAICADRDRLKESDNDAALKAALDHMNKHREASKELDSLIERWEPAQRLQLSALLVDLAQVCLSDTEKVTPLR